MMHGVVINVGVLMAAIVSGATGLAFPLIATPIFLLEYAPPQAIFITALCSLIGQFFSIGLLRQTIVYEIRWRLILAGLFGVPLGTIALIWCDGSLIRFGLGGLLVISGLWRLVGNRLLNFGDRLFSEVALGFCGGICGGMVGTSSAVPAIWLSMRGFDKVRQRAIIQPYIIAAQCASLLLLGCHGTCDAVVLQALVTYLVPLLAGVLVGTVCFRFFSCESYTKAVATLIVMSGLALLLR